MERSNLDAGRRPRHEITCKTAPYIGVACERTAAAPMSSRGRRTNRPTSRPADQHEGVMLMADHLFHEVGQALLPSAGMFWDVAWSLVLSFAVFGLVQSLVSQRRMRDVLGELGLRETALATLFGAMSSSCCYASAAVSRTLFKRRAALVPSLAFLFSSTNLVIELGIILYLLLGWQFAAAERIGDVVLVAIMAMLVRLSYPAGLVEAAPQHPEPGAGGRPSPCLGASGRGDPSRRAAQP